MIKIKLINKSNNENPAYATPGSAGIDLKAFITEEEGGNITLKPNETKLVHTGLYMEIPEGYEGQVRPRSGLALKHGITVLNSPGTVDSDYRGEVCVILTNLSNKDFTFSSGERIAQMVFASVERALFAEVRELGETERGNGGFGHTGNN